jgi:hypothetical protein
MSTVNTTATLNGLFKEVYGKSIENLVPDVAIISKMVSFKESEKVGNKFHVPVILSQEHGVTYALSGSGAFAINTPIALAMVDAQVDGSQLLLASRIDYESAAKASGSPKSFVRGTELLIKTMMESMAKRLEIAFLYGQSGLGKLTSGSGSTTTRAYVLTPASWASGIWAGTENAQIDVYNGVTKVNTNAAVNIASVDIDNKTLNVSGNAADLTAIDAVLASFPDLYFTGAYGNEMAGLDKILTNTGSLFNINAAQYGLWKSAGKAVARGLNEDAVVFMSPITYNNLNSDQAALRRYDVGYKSSELENGTNSLVYHSQNGSIEVKSHPCVKEGEAHIIPMKRVSRIGATDITFKTPGREDEIFVQLQSNAGYELRCYANQAIFIETPARCVKLTGIVNS